MSRPYLTAVALATGVFSCQAAATSALTLEGFGTLGAVYADTDGADFVGNVLEPDGAGRTRQWSPEVDSRLGVQVSGEITAHLDGVVQVVAEQQYDERYTPAVEWANLQYELAHGLKVRAGRVVLPVFMTSEYRNVGFTNPWVRPPQEVYQLVPVTNADGIDVTYQWHVGEFTHNLRATYGRKTAKVKDASDFDAEESFTLAHELQRGATTLFASYSRAELTWGEFSWLFDAYRDHGREGEAIAERYALDGKLSEVFTLGVRYDPGEWFAMAEWARSLNDSFMENNRAWYATAGYRIGTFTPYLTLAEVKATSATSHPGVGEPRLDQTLNGLLASAAQQERVAIGTRWDFTPRTAAKVQLDYLALENGSWGTLRSPKGGSEPDDTVRVFSVALDFVF